MFALSLDSARAHGSSGPDSTSLPTYINTSQGWLHTEDTYIPGVTQAELGWFAGQQRRGRRSECLKAQAIAARTYVLRWLNDHGHTARIPALNARFQAWTSRFTRHAKQAAQAVRGQVLTYQGRVIYANYASGAFPLDANGFPYAPSRYGYPRSYTWDTIGRWYADRRAGRISSASFRSRVTRYNAWAWTYVLNTNNEGRSGQAVIPTPHARRDERNRGGFGQYRAWWLDRYRNYDYQRILRAFYGEDITIVGAPGGGSTTPAVGAPPAPSTRPAAVDLVIARVRTYAQNGADELIGVGESVRFEVEVRNQGAAMTRRAPIRAEVRVDGQRVATLLAIDQLGAGARVRLVPSQGGWRPGNPGAARIEVIVDPNGEIAEARENNNRASTTRAVAAAFVVTARALNVRSGPSVRYRKVGLVRSGQQYVALERRGDWVRIDLRRGVSGWCLAGYLQPISGVAVERVRAHALNVRTGVGVTYPRIGTVGAGQLFVRRGRARGWSRIDWNGRNGWVSGGYTESLGL